MGKVKVTYYAHKKFKYELEKTILLCDKILQP